MLNLNKSVNLDQMQLKSDESGYTFSGYASVFGVTDSDGDVIEKGAFTSQLNSTPKMFFNHNHFDLPIGKWLSMEQDDHGLKVTGKLTKGNTLSEDIRASMLDDVIDGMSVGFQMTKDDYEQKSDGRLIKNISNLFEISVVTFPANGAARIDEVKSELDAITTIKDFEQFLRDATNGSRATTKTLVAKAREIFQREAEKDRETAQIINLINQIKGSLK